MNCTVCLFEWPLFQTIKKGTQVLPFTIALYAINSYGNNQQLKYSSRKNIHNGKESIVAITIYATCNLLFKIGILNMSTCPEDQCKSSTAFSTKSRKRDCKKFSKTKLLSYQLLLPLIAIPSLVDYTISGYKTYRMNAILNRTTRTFSDFSQSCNFCRVCLLIGCMILH